MTHEEIALYFTVGLKQSTKVRLFGQVHGAGFGCKINTLEKQRPDIKTFVLMDSTSTHLCRWKMDLTLYIQ